MRSIASGRFRQSEAFRLSALCAPLGLLVASPSLAQHQPVRCAPFVRLTETLPANKMTIDSTQAKIGRSIKNRANMKVL